jgi:hypothetical protein
MKLAAQLLVACVLLIVIAALLRAQTRPVGNTFEAARKALNLGQYDELARLVGSSTDPNAIALRARIDIDHGRYAEAERLLAAPANSAPGSDAALELGKLQLYLGKRVEGTRTLERLISTSGQSSPLTLHVWARLNVRSAASRMRTPISGRATGWRPTTSL